MRGKKNIFSSALIFTWNAASIIQIHLESRFEKELEINWREASEVKCEWSDVWKGRFLRKEWLSELESFSGRKNLNRVCIFRGGKAMNGSTWAVFLGLSGWK